MYLDFYSFSRAPFHITPDPEFFFLSPSHKAALGALTYGIASRQGFVALLGDTGVGKTTLLCTYLTHVHPQELQTIFVCNAQLTFDDLLRLIAHELGLTVTTDDPGALLRQLQQALHREASHGRHVALIIDEAQTMPSATLAQLQRLSDLEDAPGTPLHIVLVGRPELLHTLQHGALQDLEQRIVVRATILPLTRQESLAYIYHRLVQVAQDTPPIFTAAALQRIVQHAKGVPRVLNVLCTNALIAGGTAQQKPITEALVKRVITNMRGTRRIPVWQPGLAASATCALLASLLWLAPLQVRHGAPTLVPQPAPVQDRDRTAGAVEQTAVPAASSHDPYHLKLLTGQSEAPDAASAQPRQLPARAEESAPALDTQGMQELLTRLEMSRGVLGERLDTHGMDNLLTRLESADKTPLPSVPRPKTAQSRSVRSVPRTTVDRRTQRFPASPRQSNPALISPKPGSPWFNARMPTSDDGGG